VTEICTTTDSDSLIYAAVFFVVACCGVWLIWLMKQPLPRIPPERTELDSDDPRITRIYQGNRKTEI
jgi:hypothetical protein